MKQHEILVTIIIPIYNVENFLQQCLDSLVKQTNTNFKAILVNDGSIDASGLIAKKYAEQYPEMFTYCEQENKGLGAARNVGLQQVNTPFVAFLDSDDWLKSRSIEHIVRRIEKDPIAPDLLLTLPTIFNVSNSSFEDWHDNNFVKDLFKRYGNILNATIVPELYATEASVCRLVIRTELLKDHNFSFPEGVKWEDVFPHFMILQLVPLLLCGNLQSGFCGGKLLCGRV